MKSFQNYHRHSHYTNPRISDCIATNEDYAKRALELKHQILSTCEHGWQGNYWDCYKLSEQYGLKMLFATEAYWVRDRFEKDNSNLHIFLGAKNENGRQCLNDVLSEANITGFYNRPRVDIPLLLSLPSSDVWVTSACIAGWGSTNREAEAGKPILTWKYDDIDSIWELIANHFGKNFFFEVQNHNTKSQIELNKHILQLRDKLKVPIIMGCDSHYIFKQDAQTRTDFLESKGLTYPDEDGWYMDYPDGDTAYQRFANQGVLSHEQIVEAMSNTEIFCEVEKYDCPVFNKDVKLPSLYPDWTQEQKNVEYERLVWAGWDETKKDIAPEFHETYKHEIQKELDEVTGCGMSDYFIDNYHIIKRGKENGGQLTKTGRGSAVSFFTNCLLGFTEVDRIAAKIKMYPERFLTKTRILDSVSLPDIDFNVADPEPFAQAQQEILGEDHSYPMLAYGTYKTSAAWKLYAKSQGVPFEIANAVSEQIAKYELAIKHADEDDKENINPYDYIEPRFREIFERSKDYRGLITSWSIAPCGYLLYSGSIRREIGLVKIKDHLCCLMDGHWAEECHFLKNDLLTVSCVKLIYDSFHRAGMEPPNVKVLLDWCENDQKVWDLYKKGCTLCLNQVEKTGTSARVGIYKPTNISELSAFVAAIRPGFKSMYKVFESRTPFSYGIKAFDTMIQTPEMPNSFVMYQEQEMAALNYAGIPMSDCYTAVKNIAKKRAEKVLAYKDKFISGFSNAIIQFDGKTKEEAQELSGKLWQVVEDSASYSFNCSHSYCVALDSLYEAWLKANHPLEFYEVALNVYENKGDKDKMNALKEEAENYFDIHFPPLRFGQDNRTIAADTHTNSIINSITSIKGYSRSIGKLLYECSQNKFGSFIELLQWLDKRSCKSAKIVPLIKIDYFQQFGNTVELLRLVDLFDFFKQGEAKSISKNGLNKQMEEFISRHATDKGKSGNELKTWQITDMNGLLTELETYIFSLHLPEASYRVRAENQKEVLGYVDLTTGKEEDRRKLYVMDVFPLMSKTGAKAPWIYKLRCKSVGSGKMSSLSVATFLYKQKQINNGDIVYATSVNKDAKGYWHLTDYNIIFEV